MLAPDVIDKLSTCTYFEGSDVQAALQAHSAMWSTCLRCAEFVQELGYDAAAQYAWLRLIDTVVTAAYVQRQLTATMGAVTAVRSSDISSTHIAEAATALAAFVKCFKQMNNTMIGHTTFMRSRSAYSPNVVQSADVDMGVPELVHSSAMLAVDALATAIDATRTNHGRVLLASFVDHIMAASSAATSFSNMLTDIAASVSNTGADPDTILLGKLEVLRSTDADGSINFEEVAVFRDYMAACTANAEAMLVYVNLSPDESQHVVTQLTSATVVTASMPRALVLRAALLGIASSEVADAVAVYQNLQTNGHLLKLDAHISERLTVRATTTSTTAAEAVAHTAD